MNQRFLPWLNESEILALILAASERLTSGVLECADIKSQWVLESLALSPWSSNNDGVRNHRIDLFVSETICRSTSGSRTSETGEPNFVRNFSRLFFRRLPKKIQHFRKKFHLSPKISDDLFFNHRLFSCFNMLLFRRGAKSLTHMDTSIRGGQNPKMYINSQFYHYCSCPRGGPNSIANFDGGGAWPDLPPGSATD